MRYSNKTMAEADAAQMCCAMEISISNVVKAAYR